MSERNIGTVIGEALVAHLTHARPQRPQLLPYFNAQHQQPVAFTATTNTGSVYDVHLDSYGMPKLYKPFEATHGGSYWTRPGLAVFGGQIVGSPGFIGFDDVTGCLIVGVIKDAGTRDERKVVLRRSSTVRAVTFKTGA